MSDTLGKRKDVFWPRLLLGMGIATTVMLVAMIPVMPSVMEAAKRVGSVGFDTALFMRQSLAVKLHIAAAATALLIGIALMATPKGRGWHKPMGWVWVAAMAATAGSSFFVTGLNGDSWSFIHILSGWVIVALPMAIFAIRRRDVRRHSRTMYGLFYGGLIFTGLLTFIPGRLMWSLFLG